jgi:hypothetical protein
LFFNIQGVREFVMVNLPAYVWVLVLAGTIGIPALTALSLFRSAVAGGGGRRAASTIAAGFAAVWTAWIIVSALLANGGAYRQSATGKPPWIGVAAGGALLAVLAATMIPVVARVVTAPGSVARLTVPHVFRVVGVAFLAVMAMGKLPAVFALPAGLGDIAVGITAPFIARRLSNGDTRGAVWFNILGLLDLAVAVSLGFVAGLGADRLLNVSPSTADVTLLPLALIPTTAVPLAVALHVTSLIRLRTAFVRSPHAPSLTA